ISLRLSRAGDLALRSAARAGVCERDHLARTLQQARVHQASPTIRGEADRRQPERARVVRAPPADPPPHGRAKRWRDTSPHVCPCRTARLRSRDRACPPRQREESWPVVSLERREQRIDGIATRKLVEQDG